jgi:hypothetical protein
MSLETEFKVDRATGACIRNNAMNLVKLLLKRVKEFHNEIEGLKVIVNKQQEQIDRLIQKEERHGK